MPKKLKNCQNRQFFKIISSNWETLEQNSLVVNKNIRKAQTHLNKTNPYWTAPNLDDIKIKINQDDRLILNSF
ncbi:hypothetical protein [Mesomycoplasma ovipneumoniae]